MYNIRWYIVVVALLWLPACSCFKNDIKEIDSLVQAQTELDQIDKQTLVVFDVDCTLIKPTDTALQFLWNPQAFSKEDTRFIVPLKAKLQNWLTTKEVVLADIAGKVVGTTALKIWSQQLLKSAYVPVEAITVHVVKKLQERGIKVITLTACRPGPRGDIFSMQQWRFDELKKVGIDLSESFVIKELWLENLPLNEEYHPMFYRGILFATYTNPKSKVLAEFLDQCGWQPKRVLFFDDRKDYVEGVVREMHARGIECQGYWYRAMMKQHLKLRRDVVQVQYDYLMQHGQVISEQEAVVMLHKNNTKQVCYEKNASVS